MTTTPKEKTAKEWLKHLPEPLRTEALEACEKFPNVPDELCEFPLCIEYSINWDEAEGNSKWGKVSDQLQSGEILPVEPEQPKQPEPKPMSDTEKAAKKEDTLASVVSMFLKFNKEQWPVILELNHKFESLQKELDTRCPKQIEDKQPAPAPVKLPVTVEEVIKYGKSLQGKDKEFYKVTLTVSFLTEKEAKKFQATKILSLIAEAQNEMCERGGTAWVAYANGSKIEIADFAFSMMDFEIYFHSEQGLKDCIHANEQLWKDYLRIN